MLSTASARDTHASTITQLVINQAYDGIDIDYELLDSSLREEYSAFITELGRALHEQGKLLYEKGGLNLDALPEEVMVNVEEDYQVCVRMMARESAAESGKKRKSKS